MYAFVKIQPRTLVMASAYAAALVLSVTSSASALSEVQSASSPATKGTTVTIVGPNEHWGFDPNDRQDINPDI